MIRKRSITIAGHRTSVSLEPEFWAMIDQIAKRERCSPPALIGRIDRMRMSQTPQPGLASALRIFVLKDLKKAASPVGDET